MTKHEQVFQGDNVWKSIAALIAVALALYQYRKFQIGKGKK